MPAALCRSGGKKDGYIPTILAAGSNGIAATTWDGACPMRICARSNVGRHFGDMRRSSAATVIAGTFRVGLDKDKHCYNGPTTAERCDTATCSIVKVCFGWIAETF